MLHNLRFKPFLHFFKTLGEPCDMKNTKQAKQQHKSFLKARLKFKKDLEKQGKILDKLLLDGT